MDTINIWALLTPVALGLLIFELLYSLIAKRGVYTFQESIANMGTAIGNQTMNLLVAALVYTSFGYLHAQYALFDIPNTWWSFLALFLLVDFLFYWFHRAGHRVNILWAAHMPHHSAEEMNLAVGLRASITQRLFSFSFFLPIPFLGFDPHFMYMTIGLHLIMGYWHHTEVIRTLGWFEKWFNTPSHHRVHHGTNAQYLDKNYAEFLILWDKLFGTFEPEDEPVCYGVLDPTRSWNPLYINFQHWIKLARMTAATPFWSEKLKLWFMPPSYVPRGLPADFAKNFTDSPGMTREEQIRYLSHMFCGAKPYLVTQMIAGIGFMVFVIDGKSPLSGWEKFGFSLLIWAMVVAWSGILERRRWTAALEITRLFAMAGALFYGFTKYGVLSSIAPEALAAGLFGFASISAAYTIAFFRGGVPAEERFAMESTESHNSELNRGDAVTPELGAVA